MQIQRRISDPDDHGAASFVCSTWSECEKRSGVRSIRLLHGAGFTPCERASDAGAARAVARRSFLQDTQIARFAQEDQPRQECRVRLQSRHSCLRPRQACRRHTARASARPAVDGIVTIHVVARGLQAPRIFHNDIVSAIFSPTVLFHAHECLPHACDRAKSLQMNRMRVSCGQTDGRNAICSDRRYPAPTPRTAPAGIHHVFIDRPQQPRP